MRALARAMVVVATVVGVGFAAVPEYETPKNWPAREVLPAAMVTGPNFTVLDPVRAAGFNGSFELWVTGTLSARAKRDLLARGYTVAEQVGPRLEIID